MEADLKGPLEKLAEALHRAIEQSADVEDALARIKTEGYQAFLLLEVTVALGQPSSGVDLAEIAHALADDDDDDDDDESSSDDDDGDEGASVEDDAGTDDEAEAAEADGEAEAEAEPATTTAIERRVFQLPVTPKVPNPAVAGAGADSEEPQIAPADREFLKAIRIRLD